MTEAEFVGMLPAIKGKARRFKDIFHHAGVGVDDLLQAGAAAAWKAAITSPDRQDSPLGIFCRKHASWAMLDLFRRELVHNSVQRREHNAFDEAGRWALRILMNTDHADIERRMDLIRVCAAIEKLPSDQQEVMRRLYADGQGQAEAGAAMGVTQSRVSQIKSAAIANIRITLNLKVPS